MAANVRVGRIVGTHGLKGEMKVEVLTDFVERLEPGRRLRLRNDWVTVETARVHKDRLLLTLSGIQSIDDAKAHQWEYLEAPVDERPELGKDEYISADLIGLKVITSAGMELGKVDDVLFLPAHDVLKVGEILIPTVKQFVKKVDVPNGLIVVELIEGMAD